MHTLKIFYLFQLKKNKKKENQPIISFCILSKYHFRKIQSFQTPFGCHRNFLTVNEVLPRKLHPVESIEHLKRASKTDFESCLTAINKDGSVVLY